MGAPTPYYRMAFPNEPPLDNEFLDMDDCPPEDLERWRRDMQRFVQMLTLRKKGKRLIMKSPPHTGRIEELARSCFPERNSSTSCAIRTNFSQHAAVVGFARLGAGLPASAPQRFRRICLRVVRANVSWLQPPAAGHSRQSDVRVEVRRFGARSDAAAAANLRATGIRRFRFGLRADRGPRRFAERLQDQPPRTGTGTAQRNPPPLERLFRAVWV